MKFKIKQQGNQTIVHVSIEKNEILSEKDIMMIAQYPVKGIFTPQIKNGGIFNKNVIECVAPRSIPLAQYLGNIIQRSHFYFLLSQIVAVIGRLQQRNIPPNNIILDMRYIFVNPQNHELKFLYIPMVSVRSYADILGFIKAIVNTVKPSPQENCGYYYEFVDFCSKQKFFSLDAFTRFLVERDQNASIILRDVMMSNQQNLKNYQQYQNQYQNQYQQQAAANPMQYQQNMEMPQPVGDDDRAMLIDEEPAVQENILPMSNKQPNYGNFIPPEERGTELLSMPPQQESPEPEYLPKDKGTVLISPDDSDDDYVRVSDFKPKPLIPPIAGFKPAPVNMTSPPMPEVESEPNPRSEPEVNLEQESVPEVKPEPLPQQNQNPVSEFKPELTPMTEPKGNPEKNPIPEFKPEPIPQFKPEINLAKESASEVEPEPISQPEPIKKAENKLNIPDVTPPPFAPINDYVHYREEDEVGGTVLLSEINNPFQQNIIPKNPRLIRKRNNQEFPINKPVYRIGKEQRFVDGYITGNTAISRTHAEIVTRNNRYFITDLHSTNFTYINHSIIARETETEFYDGDIITLADEDFLFKT